MKKSIRRKINFLLIVSLIALSFFMVVSNLVIVYRTTTKNAEIIMSKSCHSLAMELNNQFRLIEQSVQNLYDVSEDLRPDLEELRTNKQSYEYIKTFEKAALNIADNTEGALAIYYHLNPDITGSGTTGFFYIRSSESGAFEKTKITDLNDYPVDDLEHVGWYYEPVWAGKAIWMEPYFNANVGVEMISYVTPIYDGNVLIGVVGIDVDFNSIMNIAESLDIYESCGAVICSMESSKVYYTHSDLFGDSVPSDIYTILQGDERSESIMNYKVDGKKYGMYYITLDNHMKLLIYAKKSEIYSQVRTSVVSSVVVFGIVFIITLLFALHMGKRIVKPIIDITEASKKYAAGDWEAKVSCDTEDELQLLTENISIMADKTKEYIDYIQDMAKKDSLTGLRNKTDYTLYVDTMKQNGMSEDKPFAVVVFDVNNLKSVNDTYGHEKGDELLLSASKFICKYFSHSPVFRIGGDEFVAIVDGGDFDKRESKLQEFQKYMDLAKNSTDIMDVCVASGMAIFGEDGSTYEEVFDIADQRMYANKKQLKNGAVPR